MSAPSAPVSANDFLDLLRRSEIVRPDALTAALEDLGDVPADPGQCAAALIRAGLITKFQAKLLLTGRFRGFKVGPYVLKEQIGQGGMGAVFLAEHETLHRKVAVKVLTTGFGNKLAVERFLREARAAAALDHPNIVRIFDVFKAADNHYLVMEYVEGDTLEQVISRGEPIACGRASGYVSQAAAGLQHAYEKGFVHRDIKPANLMLAKDGTVKILDMGLARQANSQNDKLTEVMDQGAIVGTADFISPEQAMNAPHIDIRADIYSLGATFFALVTGKPPFDGNTTQKLLQHQLKEAPSLVAIDRTFPPGLAAVIATMLRKKPEDRFQTPTEVIAALAPWLPNTGGAAKVLAGLSSSDLNSSAQLQNTLNEVMNGGTQRMTLTGMRAGGGRRLPPAVIGVGAALLVAVVFGGIYAAFGGKATEQVVPPIASAGPPPAQPPAQPPAPVTTKAAARPAVVARPVRAAKVNTIGYRLDLTSQVPFTVSGTGEKTADKARDMRLVETGRTGTGDFPAGWAGTPFGAGTEGEFTAAVVDGRMALGMKFKQTGKGNPMLLTPDRPVPPGPCRVRFEYKTAAASPNALVIGFKATGPGPVAAFHIGDKFTGSPDDWKTVEFEADLRGATSGFFEFHLKDKDPGQVLWVRAFEFGTPPAANQGRQLYALDLAGQKAFRDRGRGAAPEDGVGPWTSEQKTGDGSLPDAWLGFPWNKATRSEIAAEPVDGRMALGMKTASGPLSTMLFTPVFDAPAGRAVIKLDVKAERAGELLVRFMPKQPEEKPAFDLAKLPVSGAGWQALEFEADFKGATAGLLELHDSSMKASSWLWFRGVSVFDIPAQGDAAPAYAVNFAGTPLGTETLSTSSTRNDLAGKPLPPGVLINHYSTGTTGKYTVADVAGARALGLRFVSGGNGTQLQFQCDERLGRLAAGEAATVRLTYATTATDGVTFGVQLGQEPWTKFGTIPLPPTGGQWATVDVPFTRPADGTKYEVVVAANPPAGTADVWVKELQVLLPEPAAGPPLFHLDFAELAPARSGVRGGGANGQAERELRLPAGVFVNQFRENAAGEYQVADVGGARALGQQQTAGTDGVQLQLECGDVITKLAPGKSAVVRVTYLFDGTGVGRAAVQRQKDGNYEKFGVTELPPTGGQWRVADVPFTRPDDADKFAVIIAAGMDVPGTVHANGTLWVKSVDVLPADVAGAATDGRFALLPLAAVGTATTGRPLFLNNQSELFGVPVGRVEAGGVPFDLVDPQGGAVKNAVLLRGLDGPQPLAAPDSVVVPVNRRATAIHFLSGVGGWAWPWTPPGSSPEAEKGKVVATVRLKYADGLVEEFPWRNGEQVVDWIKRTDVPGSEFAFGDDRGHQMRYLSVRPSRAGAEVREVEFVKGEATAVALLVLAITVEGSAGSAAQAIAPAAPAAPALTAPAVTPLAGTPLAAADFSGVTAFRTTFADGKFADALPPFPPGVTGFCWKKESAAEYRGDPAAGPAVGLTNLNDALSAQLLFQVEGSLGATLQAGKAYTVWVEYKTANDAAGELIVRDPSYNPVAKAPLPGTGGQWRWASVTVNRTEGKKVDTVVENTTVGEGNTIWVRKFEVRE